MKNGLFILLGIIIGICASMFLGIFLMPIDDDYSSGADQMMPADDMNVINGYTTHEFGGVVTIDLPASCTIDGAAGSSYVICPTEDNPTPTPEMVVSSDGITVNIKKWEGLNTEFYQRAVSTLKVKTPLTRAINITIE